MRELFGVDKPIIAMVHLPPLPGRPKHDRSTSLDAVLPSVSHDVEALQRAGVDGLLFCNETDYPYQLHVGTEVAAAMAYIVGRVRAEIDCPFGVNALWDAKTSLAVARATGAAFVREVFLGVFASDFGVMAPDAGSLASYRADIGAGDVKVFTNLTPEFSRPMDDRTLTDRVRSAEFLGYDAVLISGPMAGEPFDVDHLKEAKAASRAVPVLANTGVRPTNVRDVLAMADGAIVGSSLKVDGFIWNPVDAERALDFMEIVRETRGGPDRAEATTASPSTA